MLIKTIDELKKYISTIHKNTSPNTLLSFVEGAEFKYIYPFIGSELMTELQAAYDAGTLSDDQKELMKLLGRSIAYYAMLDALPMINVNVGDAGITESQGQNFGPVRQWAYFKFEDATATNADTFLDLALAHLDRNIDKFSTWAGSEAYMESKALFINTPSELSKYMNLQNSRRAFMALQPFQVRAEEFYIIPSLGDKLHQELKASLLKPAEQTPEQRETLRLLKRALAQYTLVEAVPELSFTHTGSGLKVLNDNDGIKDRLSISMEERSNLASASRARAEIYMEDLRRFLDTVLQDSEADPADNQQAFTPMDNTGSVSFWV
ncbi:DUF6712 family protein [Pontibacter mangrovi]|uniref:Uncharacterized protein n=1 Tax=Pontibacter mangrovi TaxID=2589816 RepID=A0A501W5R7_9BACT|nr:DUF6712 family protein [Pontibacter mangrovi]TPE43985.1 hypothetical protein FJM65_11205 [Pontibacter mangrovi]